MAEESPVQKQQEFNEQVAAYREYAENQLVVDQLKTHQELAKPYFTFSNWLLLISGGVLTSAIAQASKLTELFGQGALIFVVVLAILSVICGFFAKSSETKLVGMIAVQSAMFEALEQFANRHAHKVTELRARAEREKVLFNERSAEPNIKKATEPMIYPDTWWVRFTYGSVSGERHSECQIILREIAMQAFSSKLQLFFLLLAVGFAAVFAVGKL